MHRQAAEFKNTYGIEGDIDSLIDQIVGLKEVLATLHNSQSAPELEKYRELYQGIIKLLKAQTDYISSAMEEARLDIEAFNNRTIDWDSDSDSMIDMTKMKDIALIAIQAEELCQIVQTIHEISQDEELSKSMSGSFIDTASFATLNSQLNDIHDRFNLSKGSIRDSLNALQDEAVKLFLTSVNGCSAFYVPNYARVGAKGDANNFRDRNKEKDANQLDIEDILGPTQVSLLGILDRRLYTYAHYPNIMVQLYHKAVTQARHSAEKKSCEILGKLMDLRIEYDQNGGSGSSTTRLYEIDDEVHQYTGNWVQKYNYGKFERERDEFLREERKKFWEENCKAGANAKYKDTYQAFTSKEWLERQKKLLQSWY